MDIAAFIISLFAVAFAGIMAKMAWKEQKLRLRPYLYIDTIDTRISNELMACKVVIKNIGLMVAKNVILSPVLTSDGLNKVAKMDEERSKLIMVPQQILYETFEVTGQELQNVLQGEVTLKLDFDIDYEGMGKQLYYKAHYTYSPEIKLWIFDSGDAN